MITFIEKEPFNSSVIPGRTHRLISVFMVKDGVECFVKNRRADITDDGSLWAEQQNADIKLAKSMLLSNSGIFYKLHGAYENPFEMVRWIKANNFTFGNPKELFYMCDEKGYGAGFTDFSGNLNEYSAAFKYRIYDEEMVRQLKAEIGGLYDNSRIEG